MRQFTLLFSVIFFYCNSKHEIQRKTFEEKIVDFAIVNSNDKYIELTNLYDSLSEIQSDEKEKLILVQILKKKGFKIVNWGRGNHSFGPRIVSLKLRKDTCECEVDKIYYSGDISDTVFAASERIKCYKASR